MKTRAGNADRHPGKIVAPPVRRTKEQVAASKAEVAAKKKAKVDKKKDSTERLAAAEEHMAHRDAVREETRTTRAGQTRPISRQYAMLNVIDEDAAQQKKRSQQVTGDDHSRYDSILDPI